MGIQCLQKTFCCKRGNYDRIPQRDEPIEIWNINPEELPENQYLCPECENFYEILNISVEEESIQLKCKCEKKEIIVLKIKEFLENCKKSKSKKPKYHENSNSQIIKYCQTCQKHICDNESISEHKGHELIEMRLLKEYIERNNFIENIKKKNDELADDIRFNMTIINSYQNFENNYYHIKNIINLGNSIEKEKQINSDHLNNMFKNIEKMIEDEEDKIEALKKYGILLSGNEEKLSLKKRDIDDNILQLLSQINFKNLKEINLSHNNITDIEPLKNMNLSNLQKLDLSNNKIHSIKVLREIYSPNLKDICLNNNDIEEIPPITENPFLPDLERIRIEKNNLKEKLKIFKAKLLKKYKRINLYSEVVSLENFKIKYGVENINNTKFDLSDKKAGNIILEEIYNIIGNYDIKLNFLILRNNKIKDCSLLSKIHLIHLRKLDLSVNEIKNLDFLINTRMPKLEILFLDNNNINKLNPLLSINKVINYEEVKNENTCNFNSLEVISLTGNNFDSDDKEIDKEAQFVLEKLKGKAIDLKLFSENEKEKLKSKK